jgi:hypothetical protein
MSTTTTLNETRQGEPKDSTPERLTQPPIKAEAAQKQPEQPANIYPRRDAGANDRVWEQVERDRRAEQDREEEYQQLLKA